MGRQPISSAPRARTLFAALAIAALATAATAPPALAVPKNFWGVSPQIAPSPEQFQRLKTGGVGSVRIPIAWEAVQSSRGGGFEWGGYDALVGGAAAAP